VKVNDDVHKLVFRIRAETLNWYSNAIIDIYGEQVKNFALDFATILNGMLKEYLFYIAIDKKEINLEQLASFLIKRLDAMIKSLTDEETPLLTYEVMKDYIDIEHISKEKVRKQIIKQIDEMIEKLEDESDKNNEVSHDVIHSLNTLKKEFSGSQLEARKFIVEALLLYLQNVQHIDLTRFVKELKAKMEVYFTY
jgi:hypothetical protein